MTPELHAACQLAGTDLVATAVELLSGACSEDGSDIPLRDALAAELARWAPDQPATGVDPALVALVAPDSASAHLVGYRLRVAEATEDPTPLGRLMVAAWREYDAALLARMLEDTAP